MTFFLAADGMGLSWDNVRLCHHQWMCHRTPTLRVTNFDLYIRPCTLSPSPQASISWTPELKTPISTKRLLQEEHINCTGGEIDYSLAGHHLMLWHNCKSSYDIIIQSHWVYMECEIYSTLPIDVIYELIVVHKSSDGSLCRHIVRFFFHSLTPTHRPLF